MAEEAVVVTVDSALDDLVAKVDAVEKANTELKNQNVALIQSVADLKSQVEKHTNDGSLTESQLKKLQDATARLSKLVS